MVYVTEQLEEPAMYVNETIGEKKRAIHNGKYRWFHKRLKQMAFNQHSRFAEDKCLKVLGLFIKKNHVSNKTIDQSKQIRNIVGIFIDD